MGLRADWWSDRVLWQGCCRIADSACVRTADGKLRGRNAAAYRNDQERECVSKRCLSVDRFGESASLGECMRQDFGVKWPLDSVLEVCQTLLRCCLFDDAVGIYAPSNSSR